ncbi:site-2 protease family protein [Paenibacillus sp. ACRRX]|uniref:site-2 protease family protein n=1 Tax=unclassified Paenibacillus TaxID=185978 RepID=UPI001EF4CA99|nr:MULTISPECIES: site-2 protease family protein [unclassified Paenibacillus]MCG7407866.1 site-2 protease family protein [Paenibacillus sp. ACRRX]MDK8181009.1 site-2 protease family protein [Paenibacillus sp. UMB4589-SE434]
MGDWNNFFAVPLDTLPFLLLVLMIAFTVHEFSHAFFAWKFGDPTAKMLGRVSLNPARHLDVLGTLLFVIAGFGWAKPVPVNRDNFKNPRLMGIIVSAAGPISNLLLAFISMLVLHLCAKFGWVDFNAVDRVQLALKIFFHYLIMYNILLFLFNLIPLPPLDGYRILEDLAPRSMRLKLMKFEQWSVFIFLLIVFLPPLRRVTLDPLFDLIQPIYMLFSRAAYFLVGV